MQQLLTYDDVLLVPQYSELGTRKDVDLSVQLDPLIKLSIPIIASPMDTVTESAMAIEVSKAGGLGVIHRYNSIEDQAALVHEASMEGTNTVGAAVGASGDFEERACALFDAGARVLCVDVAHGHHVLVRDALLRLRGVFANAVHLMAGNVATLEGFNDLADWGADSIRCGIGTGSICTTRIKTGHGVPALSTIFECAKTHHDVTIIADGGIREPGDIVKAIAAGADVVMLGSMLAGTTEAPGELLHGPNGRILKNYRGMASKDAQVEWRGKTSSPEGVSSVMDYRGDVAEVIDDIVGAVKSGFSYSGARDSIEMRGKARWAKQSSASQVESSAHIFRTG